MKRPLKFPLKFEKGIREITNKDTTKEALKAFTVLLLSELRGIQVAKFGRFDEALLQKQLRENIERFREKGFEEEWLFERLRREYIKLPRRAPRKRVKKEFDANGVPKVTKTPLDAQLSAFLGYLKVTRSD
jgi:hypothetical protein